MLCFIYLMLFAVFGVQNICSVDSLTRVKRTEIDLQTCIDNFDVHKDKIIRTQDSRDMGAKYLNEIDLGSREECLRLCCETETCDVFVFEEKSPGSCYLFHCGPPEDFKCKFTRHVNYSSAVLAINRHNELETEIKMTKHEQDLTRLRKPEENLNKVNTIPVVETTKIPTIPSTTREIVSKELLPVPQEKDSERTCSRYQFECRSTSECIAIYNACDGIPQCADGSDEAPELGCPAATSAPTSPPSVNLHTKIKPHPNFPNYESIPSFPKNHPKIEESILPAKNIPPIIQSPHLPPEPQYEHPDSMGAQIPPPRALPVLSPAYPDSSSGNLRQPIVPFRPTNVHQNPWIPHQSNQMPAAVLPQNPNQYSSQYIDQNSHIFNHKVNSIQVGEGVDSVPAGINYNEPNNIDFSKIPNYFNSDLYRPQLSIPESWQLTRPQENQNNPFIPPNIPENWQTMQLPQNNLLNQPSGAQFSPPYIKKPEISANWTPPKTPLLKKEPEKTITKTLNSNLKNNAVAEKDTIPVINKTKIEKTIPQPQNSSTHNHHSSHNLKSTDDITIIGVQDIESNTPSGAILSLTLGLCITTIMIIIVGCRLRVVRKRMRRGGKSPYAHDADYLVNGMYL